MKNEQIIKLSLKSYNVGSSSDSQEKNVFLLFFLQVNLQDLSSNERICRTQFKQYPCEARSNRRGALRPYARQFSYVFDGSLQTCIEDKTTSTIKSVQTQSTFIWQVVKAVAYK